MKTKLSKQIVFNYIKNFCYSPVYSVAEALIAPEDIPSAPFQFNSSTYYTVGAYIVKNDQLYIVIRDGSGPWSSSSIANTYGGEAYSGEKEVADVETEDYDPGRFAPVTIEEGDTLTVYEIVNDRTGRINLAFDTYANAIDYIRDYITNADYSIRVEQSDNRYTAYWDDHVMEFFEPKESVR